MTFHDDAVLVGAWLAWREADRRNRPWRYPDPNPFPTLTLFPRLARLGERLGLGKREAGCPRHIRAIPRMADPKDVPVTPAGARAGLVEDADSE